MNATFSAGHHHRSSGISVDGNTDIQFLRNVSLFAHQNLANLEPFDLFSKEFARQIFKVFRGFSGFDAPGQASPPTSTWAFKMTGYPISPAIRAASSTDSATSRLGTGIFMLSKTSAPSYSWSLIAIQVPFKDSTSSQLINNFWRKLHQAG